MDGTDELFEKLLKDITDCWRRLDDHAGRLTVTAVDLSESTANSVQELIELRERITQASNDAQQGTDRGDYHTAFGNASTFVRDMVTANPESKVSVKILAVAAVFSWRWIVDDLVPIFKQNPQAECNLQMLLVDPDFAPFQAAGRTSEGVCWADISRERVRHAQQLMEALANSMSVGRFSLTIKYYSNLPHWHGVLIDNLFLLLGSATWLGEPPDANLRLGENSYRQYNIISDLGRSRIAGFEDWFRYYNATSTPAYPL